MLKSISNIAWEQKDEEWVIDRLHEYGWNAIEVAPSRIWKDFRMVPRQQRADYRKALEERGIKICSMHSLFWGVKDVNIFGSELEQKNLIEYLKELVDLAVYLKSRVMVLGSPTVRDRNGYEYNEALEIASRVLYKPAVYACENGVKILIEPLSRQETNFINTHSEGLELTAAVNDNGFGLHLDAKSIADEETDLEKIVYNCRGKIEHFHINDPGLAEIGTEADYHLKLGELLKKVKYDRYVSIEMRQFENYRETIDKSMKYVDVKY